MWAEGLHSGALAGGLDCWWPGSGSIRPVLGPPRRTSRAPS